MSGEIKNIVFDFNGVVSKSNKSEIIKKIDYKDICNLFCYGFSFLTNSGFRNDVKSAYKSIMMGKISCENIYALFENQHPNKSGSIKKIIESFIDSMRTQDGLILLIDYLRSNGFRVYILSNSIPKTERMIKSEEIESHFDGVYCSNEFGLIKPDIAIYEDACKKWGILPQESIFIDDKKENVKGAKNAGFNNAFCLTDEDQIIQQVSSYVL